LNEWRFAVLIIGPETVRRLLSMRECIGVMDRAMRAASNGAVLAPDRIIAPLGDGLSYFIAMPGCLESPPLYGAKLVGLHPSNPAAGLPAVQGFVALFDGGSGTPRR
jgi:ornithine cyclodeaminase